MKQNAFLIFRCDKFVIQTKRKIKTETQKQYNLADDHLLPSVDNTEGGYGF
jgi:hypothetical protein